MFSKADVEKYFLAEKGESLLFVFIGIAALIAAVVFYFLLKTPFYKGAVIPLAAIAILQMVVGYTVYRRSDGQRKDIVYKMDMNPAAIRDKEVPGMELVMKKFLIYRRVEIALLAIGLACCFVSRGDATKAFWCGLGLALALQTAIMLAANYFAEARGKSYLQGLNWLFKK
ncbi:MAG: hypothetical protein ABIX01_09115 [Chitinophagaceae bacterium]